MKTLKNLALGAMLAAVCLAPAAGSDAAGLFEVGVVPAGHQKVGAGHLLSPLEQATSAIRSAFPQLFIGASLRLVAASERH